MEGIGLPLEETTMPAKKYIVRLRACCTKAALYHIWYAKLELKRYILYFSLFVGGLGNRLSSSLICLTRAGAFAEDRWGQMRLRLASGRMVEALRPPCAEGSLSTNHRRSNSNGAKGDSAAAGDRADQVHLCLRPFGPSPSGSTSVY